MIRDVWLLVYGQQFEVLGTFIGYETILWIKVCCGYFHADVASPPLSATLRSAAW
jgi:hypothetical protein